MPRRRRGSADPRRCPCEWRPSARGGSALRGCRVKKAARASRYWSEETLLTRARTARAVVRAMPYNHWLLARGHIAWTWGGCVSGQGGGEILRVRSPLARARGGAPQESGGSTVPCRAPQVIPGAPRLKPPRVMVGDHTRCEGTRVHGRRRGRAPQGRDRPRMAVCCRGRSAAVDARAADAVARGPRDDRAILANRYPRIEDATLTVR